MNSDFKYSGKGIYTNVKRFRTSSVSRQHSINFVCGMNWDNCFRQKSCSCRNWLLDEEARFVI